MDDETVMQRASELGMVMPEDTQSGLEIQQTETDEYPNSDEVISPDTQNDTQEDISKDTQADVPEDTKADKPKDTEDDAEPKGDSTDETPKKVKVTIKKGEGCGQLAENLYELGVIDDVDAFREYMQEHGYDNRIRVGTHQLSMGMTYEEIANVCTFR